MGLGRRRALVGQQEQVAAFGVVELQGMGHAEQEFLRHLDLAPLLEPGVPGEPHAGHHRDLFAPQAGCAPPPLRGQAHIGGRELATVPGQ
ncbi:hypothetical protein D3C72_1968340 [compost metagenome]